MLNVTSGIGAKLLHWDLKGSTNKMLVISAQKGASEMATPSKTEGTQFPTILNPEMWVQLTVEQHQKTSRLLEEQQQQTTFLLNTVQQLQEEMIRVRRDNERLLQDQEKILKSLSDR